MNKDDTISTVSFSQVQKTLPQEMIEKLRKRIVLVQAQWIIDSKIIGNVFYATGFFLDSDILLTAAHNIYSYNYQKFATKIKLYFLAHNKGINQSHQELKCTLNQQNFKCTLIKDARNKSTYENDIAIIRVFNHTINDEIKILKDFAFNKQSEQKCYVIGFPDFFARQTFEFKQRQQLKNRVGPSTLTVLRENMGKIVRTEPENNHLFYKTKTVAGQSGSPVLIVKDKEIYFIGIHTCYSINKQVGRAFLFTQQITNKIANWSRQLVSPDKNIPYVDFRQFNKFKDQKNQKVQTKQPEQIQYIQKYTTLANQQVIIFFDRINKMQKDLENIKCTFENALIDMQETYAKVINFQQNQIQGRFHNFMEYIDALLNNFTKQTSIFLQIKQNACLAQKSRIQIYSNGISQEEEDIFKNSQIDNQNRQDASSSKRKIKHTKSYILPEQQYVVLPYFPSLMQRQTSKDESLFDLINQQLKITRSDPVGK